MPRLQQKFSNHLFKFFTLLIFIVLLFSFGCSEEPTAPEGGNGEKPEGTVTIGIDGGVIEKGDFKIIIPAGAFTEDHDISVYEVDDDEAFGENTVSASFKINGLPFTYNKPIAIKSKYLGQLNGDSFLAIGQIARDKIETDSSVVYSLYTATDSSGVLTSYLPTFNLPKATKNLDEIESLELFAKFLDSYAFKETNHFLIFFPLSAIQQVSKVEEMFEDAYAVVKHGLVINEEILRTIIITSQNIPIIVNQEVFNENYLVHRFSISKESLINQQYNEIQVRAVQELFFFSGTTLGFEDIHWIRSAIYNWIEDWISDAPEYQYPKNLFYNGMNPFSGFETANQNYLDGFRHGRGMSGLIKYLIELENYGLSGLKTFLISGYSSSKLLESIDTPINQWWPDFFKKYVNNELFELPDDYFIENAHAIWDINSKEDISKTFISTYQDLSAKLFTINLNYSDIDASQKMLFSMKGPVTEVGLSLVTFGIQNGNAVHLGTVDAKDFELANLKEYYDNNIRQFLVCLVNSTITSDDYLGKSDIEFNIQVTPRKNVDDIPFDFTLNQCFVSIMINGTMETRTASSVETATGETFIGSVSMDGQFIGKTFTGSYSDEYTTSNITVTLDETNGFVDNFDWTYNTNSTYIQEAAGGGIPIYYNTGWFRSDGVEVCNKIVHLKSEKNIWGTQYSLIDYGCTDTSHIVIAFRKTE